MFGCKVFFIVLEKYHIFMKYFCLKTIMVIGCKELCSFGMETMLLLKL